MGLDQLGAFKLMSITSTAIAEIERHLGPLLGKRLLNVGCGSGGLRGQLEKLGANWTGLEPFDEGGEPKIVKAPAQEMPFSEASFDGVIFVNSLHHVPAEHMKAALAEAARVLAGNGRIVIIEPEIEGALSKVVAVVDDETQIRSEAQAAINEAICSGFLIETASQRYMRREKYASFDEFSQKISAVSPDRAALISRQADALKRAFEAGSAFDEVNWLLEQPMHARILEHARNP